MAAPKKNTKKKVSAFKLETDSRFETTGRGVVTWFKLLEPDDEYNKLGGKFFPQDASKMEGVIDDVLAEIKAVLDDEGITATEINPQKKNDDGEVFYSVSRPAQKADGTDAVITMRQKNGKKNPDILDDDELGNGSIVNIKVMFRGYFMPEKTEAGITIPARYGVSMMPIEVQVIEHKIYDQEDDGFADESGEDDDGSAQEYSEDGKSDTESDDY